MPHHQPSFPVGVSYAGDIRPFILECVFSRIHGGESRPQRDQGPGSLWDANSTPGEEAHWQWLAGLRPPVSSTPGCRCQPAMGRHKSLSHGSYSPKPSRQRSRPLLFTLPGSRPCSRGLRSGSSRVPLHPQSPLCGAAKLLQSSISPSGSVQFF